MSLILHHTMQLSIYLHGFLAIFLLSLWQVPTFAAPKHYIIHLGSHHAEPRLSTNPETITNSHHELISSVLASIDFNPSERIVYSYNKILNAFAANLHEEEANELAKHPSVASITESRTLKLSTTRSVDFLGFPNQPNNDSNIDESIWVKASYGDGIIIANLDFGVWPESQSFLDQGYGPVPKKFRGACENEHDPTFKCNRKLIGARYFYKGLKEGGKLINYTFNDTLSPRDHNAGHGTHTLSIAGGNIVPGVSFYGFANGTAKGVAPRARLVAYKNVWHDPVTSSKGSSMDLLAAFEAAVDDNVDVISLSLSRLDKYTDDEYLFDDTIAIASFHAMKNGILTVACAGNDGPEPGAIDNVAPWLFTVGASTMDREFSAYVTLGNQQMIKGARFIDEMTTDPNKLYPLITGAEARNSIANINDAMACRTATLDASKVKGKIVVCLNSNNESENYKEGLPSNQTQKAGAAGLILVNEKNIIGFGSLAKPQSSPTVIISYKDGETLFSYINSTRSPTASMSNGTTTIRVKPSPVMASFSSRGPSNITTTILKPDVTAPGANILAAYPPTVEPKLPYAISHGTSMSTPHVAGIAALVKKVHPDWSTAAIKSAIMTTANPLDNTGMPLREEDLINEATPFAYGSGHVTPNKAMDPGLVYDMDQYDYLNFICASTHQNSTTIDLYIKHHSYKCPSSFNILDFNYPSITIPDFSGHVVVTRKLKNVGKPSTYEPRINAPPGVSIVVEPKKLVFTKTNQMIMFKLIFTADVKHLPNDYIFGSLVWSDAKHVVRSPIVIKAKQT